MYIYIYTDYSDTVFLYLSGKIFTETDILLKFCTNTKQN